MRTVLGRISLLVISLMLVCLSMPAFSAPVDEDLDARRERLDQLQKQIEETLKGLRSKKTESGSLAEELESLGNEVRRVERLAKSSDRRLAALTTQIEAKRKELDSVEAQQRQTEQQIRQRLVVLYKTGEVGLVKALLAEAETPKDIAEKYAFLSRMVRHDRDLLEKYRQQSTEYQAALDELETLRTEQAELVARQRRQQNVLQQARKNKSVLLAEVKQDAALLEKMLKDLRAKAARLNDLVKKLETQQAQPYTETLEGLQAQKGQLLWPVAGKLRVGFGTRRHGELGTLIESHGFEIEAAVGTPVNATAKGRVIFANNLRGYGKLMILDHGGKYYTLYAHMARFTRQVGDAVGAADVIAYSGFEGRDSVYFEIRQGGKPLDPSDWLRAR